MNSEKKINPNQSPKKKSKIPYIFFAFFAVIFAINFFYIYLSQKTWRGVVTKDSYQKGLNYNDIIKQVKNQKKLGWKIDATYIPFAGRGSFKVKLLDKDSTPIKDAAIYVTFKRPAQEGLDFLQVLPFQDGSYKADIFFPVKGQWDAEINITKGEDTFVEVKRYVIQ